MSKPRRWCLAVLGLLSGIGIGLGEWHMAIGNGLALVFLLVMHCLEQR